MNGPIATLAVILSLPHLLYMYIWFWPESWRVRFKQPIDTFAQVAAALKVLQFSSFLAWYYHARLPHSILDVQQIRKENILGWVFFLAFGQALNIGIYKAIGHVGVYYGFKLGKTVPWVHDFPFNVVSHPQYVGSVMSVWSISALMWYQRPEGLLSVTAFWTGLYVLTALQEQYT